MVRIFGIDLRSLALFRVMLGLTLLINIANYWPWISDFFSDRGIITRSEAIAQGGAEYFSLFYIAGAPWMVAVLFLFFAVAAVMLLVGYKSRLASFICFIFLVSLINRNAPIHQGGDKLMLLLCFWGMFLPLGARFAIDAALKPDSQEDIPNQYFSAGSVAILLQAIYVYFFGALLKDSPIWIPDGQAVYYALNIDSYVTPLGLWLREYFTLTQLLTYYVWGLELLAPVLMFSPVFHIPLRLIGLLLLVTLHLGFAMFLTIGLFPLVSITSLTLFVPGWVWERLAARFYPPSRRAIVMYYDRGCVFCEKTCRILRSFCLTNDNTIRPAQDDPVIGPILEANNSWVVTDAKGHRYLGWVGVTFILRQSPVFYVLGRILSWPLFAALGERLYRLIGRSRMSLGRVTERLLPYRRLMIKDGKAVSLIIILFTLYVAAMNIFTLRKIDYRMPAQLMPVTNLLRLDQEWSMFAPFPQNVDGWLVMRGEYTDGSPIDLWREEIGEPAHEAPAYLAGVYKDYRWRKFFTQVHQPNFNRHLQNYARYICRTHNIFEPRSLKLSTITITLYRYRIQVPGEARQAETVNLLNWNCLG